MCLFFIFLSLPLSMVCGGKIVCLHSFTNIGLLGHWVFSPPATRQEFGLHTHAEAYSWLQSCAMPISNRSPDFFSYG